MHIDKIKNIDKINNIDKIKHNDKINNIHKKLFKLFILIFKHESFEQ
jgi:hypothetical protein